MLRVKLWTYLPKFWYSITIFTPGVAPSRPGAVPLVRAQHCQQPAERYGVRRPPDAQGAISGRLFVSPVPKCDQWRLSTKCRPALFDQLLRRSSGATCRSIVVLELFFVFLSLHACVYVSFGVYLYDFCVFFLSMLLFVFHFYYFYCPIFPDGVREGAGGICGG